MIIDLNKDEVIALKWLLIKGMEITKSKKKFESFESIEEKINNQN